MKKIITNEHQIDLPVAVWLLQDGYNSGRDKAPPGELISVTSLMKPIRQQILQRKVDLESETLDISQLIRSRMGHGLHDSMERAWTEGDWQNAMRLLKYPQDIIDKMVINPDPKEVKEGQIPIYLEQRGYKEVGGIVLTGQLDFAIAGAYRDTKTTSTFSYTSGSKDKDYILQGSLYRYIMPHIITQDKMRIEFIFTDWQSYRVKEGSDYPEIPVAHKEFPLMSIEESEDWVLTRIDDIKKNAKLKQDKMIRCTDEELWRGKDEYKYYSNPETAKKNGRCSKRFKNRTDAELHLKEKGKGVIVTDPGEVKACLYCPAFSVCEQRKEYFPDEK